MDTRRQQKIGTLIQKEFADIINRELKGLFGKALVSIPKVIVTSDLSIARFYLSIFNADDKQHILGIFEERTYELRKILGDKLRHQLRKIPELEFYIDDTMDYVYRMEEIFREIKSDPDKDKAPETES
jgi:ribosome-binding factor A